MDFIDEQYSTYFSVALRSYEKANYCKESLDTHLAKEPITGDEMRFLHKMVNKVEKESLIGFFLALTLEAFISDYAIRRMSPEHYEKEVKRLGPAQKWKNVPEFVMKKRISTEVLGKIEKLVSLRNEIANSKSVLIKDVSFMDQRDLLRKANKIHAEKAVVTKHINEAMETVQRAVRELNQIDQTVSLFWLHQRDYHNLFVSEKDEFDLFLNWFGKSVCENKPQ